MPKLRRTRDGAGDSGPVSKLYHCEPDGNGWFKPLRNENNELIITYGKPKLNCIVEVGSIVARTYQQQDFWRTTPVTEILEETDDYVRFKTTNSEYEWWA